MDGYQFSAEMFKALVWPLTLLILAWQFKKQIEESIEHLAKRIKKAKGAGLEAEFGEMVRSLEAGTKAIDEQKSETDKLQPDDEQPDDEQQDDELPDIHWEFGVAPNSHSVKVVEAFNNMMATGRAVLLIHNIKQKKGTDLEMIGLLLKHYLISVPEMDAMRKARSLSRLAASGGDAFIAPEDARIAIESMDRVTATLAQRLSHAELGKLVEMPKPAD